VDLKRAGIIFADNNNMDLGLSNAHPGFAWAFRRDFIEPKGIFDENIIGSGDTILGSAVLGKQLLNSDYRDNSPKWMINNSNIYCKLFSGKYTYYTQNAYHLWHGSMKNRRYINRHTEFNKGYNHAAVLKKDDFFVLNNDGLYEYKEEFRESLNEILLNYFKGRDEDGV
jgi:hypothetical protein